MIQVVTGILGGGEDPNHDMTTPIVVDSFPPGTIYLAFVNWPRSTDGSCGVVLVHALKAPVTKDAGMS